MNTQTGLNPDIEISIFHAKSSDNHLPAGSLFRASRGHCAPLELKDRAAILIADDEEFVRFGLRHILQEHRSDLKIVEAADARSATIVARAARPAIAIIDVAIPGSDVMELCRGLTALHTGVILCAAEPVGAKLSAALEEAGAIGWLLQTDSPSAVVAKVECAMHRASANKGRPEAHGKPGKAILGLTPREFEIARMLSTGSRNKDIAWSLNLSIRTVEAHRERIRRKLRIDSVSELTLLFAREELQ